mgnify:CR=1 FL=1
MPTPNKRISVILSPELDAALLQLKRASGMSPSSYIRQVMESSRPLILKMATAFETARKSPEAGIIALQELADSVTVSAAQLSLDVGPKQRHKVRQARRVLGRD